MAPEPQESLIWMSIKPTLYIRSQDVPLVQMPAKITLAHGCQPLTIWKSTSLSDPVLAATPGALCFLEQSFQLIFNLIFWHSRWLESGLFPLLPMQDAYMVLNAIISSTTLFCLPASLKMHLFLDKLQVYHVFFIWFLLLILSVTLVQYK